MRNLRTLFSLALIFYVSMLTGQPVDADIVVDLNGTGDFTTIQAAIDAVPSSSSTETVIYIKRGVYDQEKLVIPSDKKNLTLIGESREETIISYDIYNCNDGEDGMCPDDKVALWSGDNIRTAATMTILANDFRAENLTIENTAGPVGQAQAITVRGDRSVFVNCNLTGYQDTIYLWLFDYSYRAYFENCLIVGRTDYIYGHGIGYFNECEIRSWGGGWITAPATDESQSYGFVFYKCDLTYATGSPRSGDDGAYIRLGRPWHNYPKVAWLYCNMTEKIHPEGWGDKWNMNYADTDTRLHLYEYQNTGTGANMSGRAAWAGLRPMTEEEAPDYEPEVVLAGSDDWDPTVTPPAVTVFNWTGGGTTSGWLESGNWNPVDTPTAGEVANIDGNIVATADGSFFEADLHLKNGAILDLTADSEVKLLTLSNSGISCPINGTLSGAIKTKDTTYLDVTNVLNLSASVSGVHEVIKRETGEASLNAVNSGFSGTWIIQNGVLKATADNSLGKAAKVEVQTNGTLNVVSGNAFFPTTALSTKGSATVTLSESITISEWYIDGALQSTGEYDASTHPNIINGTGVIVVGRPDEFIFVGGDNGNWDNPAHYSPPLLPETGETVIVEKEIEAVSTPFLANMLVQNGGAIRLRSSESKSEGTITMHQGTQIRYATSGSGFTLDAPIILTGDIVLSMNSANENGSIMNLPGTFEGSHKVTVLNTRTNANGSATVDLSGDNRQFDGTWDLNTPSATTGAITAINGLASYAFGKGKIEAAADNQVIFNHADCTGDTLNLTLSESAKAVLNVDVFLNEFTLNGEKLQNNKVYDASTHPGKLSGTGSITVGDPSQAKEIYNLIILISGSGSVNAEDTYEDGEEVTITATPNKGWEFEGWTGDIVDTSPTITFTMTKETTLTATFNPHKVLGLKDSGSKIYVYDRTLVTRGIDSWSLFTFTGKMIYTNQTSFAKMLNHLNPGVYIVRFLTANGTIQSRKIVLE